MEDSIFSRSHEKYVEILQRLWARQLGNMDCHRLTDFLMRSRVL